MVKKIILICILTSVIVGGQDWRTRQYIHAVVADSAGTMRGTVSDTADVVRTEYGSGDNTVKGIIRDTATVVWSDSVPTIRGEIRDTINGWWGDTSSVILRKDGTVPLTNDWAMGDYDITGLEKIETDSATIGDLTVSSKLTSTSVTRGQATFTADALDDTVAGIIGVSTNSIILLTPKMAKALTGQLSWTYLNTDSILVRVLAADTVARQVTYSWFRIE